MEIRNSNWNKAIETQNKFGGDEESNLMNNDDIEKSSYSEASYKKVQKLREKSKYCGLNIPYLQFPVEKQEKPRPMFIALGVLYALMFAIVLAFSVVLIINLIIPMVFQTLGISSSYKLYSWDVLGLFALFSGVINIIVWVIIVIILMLIVAINVFFARQMVNMFKMSRISMQEMAVGYEVQSILLRLATVIGITLFSGIAILIITRNTISEQGIWIIIGIMVGMCAFVGTIFGLVLAQRIKAKKKFDKLSEEQQNDFIRHNMELNNVRRKKGRRISIIGSSRVDF